MPNILTRAQSLVELAEKATPAPWAWGHNGMMDKFWLHPVPFADTGDYVLYVCGLDGASQEDREMIAASRNDGPAIAQALVEAVDILARLDQHMDFSIPWDDGVCDEGGNGYEDASGVNKAMEDARDFLTRLEMTRDA